MSNPFRFDATRCIRASRAFHGPIRRIRVEQWHIVTGNSGWNAKEPREGCESKGCRVVTRPRWRNIFNGGCLGWSTTRCIVSARHPPRAHSSRALLHPQPPVFQPLFLTVSPGETFAPSEGISRCWDFSQRKMRRYLTNIAKYFQRTARRLTFSECFPPSSTPKERDELKILDDVGFLEIVQYLEDVESRV